jgi:hypothetical protein
MSKLKIFELRWTNQDEKEWIAAHTNIDAIKQYCSITSTDLADLDEEDEVVELSESEWEKMTIKNVDYDPSDPEDWEEKTFAEFMENRTCPDLVAGTMYF